MDMQLKQLKKKLDASAQAHLQSQILLKKREELHDHILLLKMSRSSEKSLLQTLKAELKELDQHLDTLEETLEIDQKQLKGELIQEIQKTHPATKTEYLNLETQLNTKKQQCQRLVSLKQKVNPFYEALSVGAHLPKNRGIFSLLFGKSSKVLLAQAIHQATIEGEKIQHQLDNEEMTLFLNQFLIEAKKNWNRKLYKGHFNLLFQQFAPLIEKLNQNLSFIQQEVATTEQMIDSWIEINILFPV